MRSSTFIAAIASVASSFSLVAAGQPGANSGDSPLRILSGRDNTDSIKRDIEAGNLVAAPARSRHASRDHRAHARHARHAASKPKSSLKKRQSSRCKVYHSQEDDGVSHAVLPDSSDDSSSSSSSSSSGSSSSGSNSSSRNTSGTIEDEKTTSSGSTGGIGDLDLDTSSNFLKIGNIYAGFLPGKHRLFVLTFEAKRSEPSALFADDPPWVFATLPSPLQIPPAAHSHNSHLLMFYVYTNAADHFTTNLST